MDFCIAVIARMVSMVPAAEKQCPSLDLLAVTNREVLSIYARL